MIDVIRTWLEVNQIFFTTLATIFLTIMAIIVSLSQNSTAKKQAKIMEDQSKIMSFQLQLDKTMASPHITAEIKPIYDSKTKNRISEQINVKNSGTDVFNVKCEVAILWVITTLETKIKRHYIPIKDYFLQEVRTNNSKGKLITLSAAAAYEVREAIMIEYFKYIEKHDTWSSIATFEFLHIEYKDIFNEKFNEYLHISPRYGSEAVDKSTAERFFEIYRTGLQKPPTPLEKLTIEMIFKETRNDSNEFKEICEKMTKSYTNNGYFDSEKIH